MRFSHLKQAVGLGIGTAIGTGNQIESVLRPQALRTRRQLRLRLFRRQEFVCVKLLKMASLRADHLHQKEN